MSVGVPRGALLLPGRGMGGAFGRYRREIVPSHNLPGEGLFLDSCLMKNGVDVSGAAGDGGAGDGEVVLMMGRRLMMVMRAENDQM